MENCSTCKYFAVIDGKVGNCRRFPPVPFPVGPNNVSTIWPAVRHEQWCGEWRQIIYLARDVPKPQGAPLQ